MEMNMHRISRFEEGRNLTGIIDSFLEKWNSRQGLGAIDAEPYLSGKLPEEISVESAPSAVSNTPETPYIVIIVYLYYQVLL